MRQLYIISAVLLLVATCCTKVDYNTVSSPTYIRVFNSLNYTVTLANKDQPPNYITMVIDPTIDSSTHAPTGGGIVGDFLDTRLSYAPPAPNNAGSTNVVNNEYPGNAKVLTAPILNGFDLSSWASIPSGKHRFVFYSRPRNTTPFFQLPASARTTVFVDTTMTLAEGEVYTMEVLQPDAYSSNTSLYLRQEQFQNESFSDSIIYVNFYNLSSANYLAYSAAAAVDDPNVFPLGGGGLRDTVSVYYSLYTPDNIAGYPGHTLIPGFNNLYMTTLVRSLAPTVAPYFQIPLFVGFDSTGGILSKEWELFTFLAPAYQLPDNPFSSQSVERGNYGTLQCTDSYYYYLNSNGIGATGSPNLMITTASGPYSSRSFATVNTIEVINNQTYVMTIQRVYAPPTN